MNLFVAGWSAERPVDAPAALLGGIPFFPGRPVRTWTGPSGRAAAAWVAHTDEYEEVADDRLVLWSGHPEGRFARVSYDRRTERFDIEADPMGAYPVYAAERDGVTWLSNNPTLIRGSDDTRVEVTASLVGGGWSLSGDPLWSEVRRVDAGLAPADVVPLIGAGLDPDAAAADLTDVTRLLADWPRRPNVVPVTAGRDSRLVLAAALRAGVEFTTNTGGNPGEPDVDVGRELARIAGVPHELIADDPHGSLHEHWRRAAELLTLTAGGTATLADAVGFPFGPRPGPLPLWHSGQGGEIGRGYYSSTGGDADSIYRAFVMRRPHRRELLNDEGERIVRGQIEAWVDEVKDAGADPADIPDLFYLLQRMGRWAGPTHGAVEYVRDTTSPLWHRRMLPHLLGLPAAERAREEFHLRLLEKLAPELAAAPGWPQPQSELRRRIARARSLAGKVQRELRRRARARKGSVPELALDPFAAVHADVREVVLDRPDHPAWQVLDRPRTEAVLTRDAAALDEVSRYHVWRLATVFAAKPPG